MCVCVCVCACVLDAGRVGLILVVNSNKPFIHQYHKRIQLSPRPLEQTRKCSDSMTSSQPITDSNAHLPSVPMKFHTNTQHRNNPYCSHATNFPCSPRGGRETDSEQHCRQRKPQTKQTSKSREGLLENTRYHKGLLENTRYHKGLLENTIPYGIVREHTIP